MQENTAFHVCRFHKESAGSNCQYISFSKSDGQDPELVKSYDDLFCIRIHSPKWDSGAALPGRILIDRIRGIR